MIPYSYQLLLMLLKLQKRELCEAKGVTRNLCYLSKLFIASYTGCQTGWLV